MPDREREGSPKLYVEGDTDFHFVEELRSKHLVKSCWRTEAKTGFASVMKAAREAVVVRGAPPVGIVVDADATPSCRWDEIIDHFSKPEVADKRTILLPAQPCPDGTIVEQADGFPRIGVWVMPDNILPGELEDFVCKMVRHDDPIWPKSQNYVNAIPHHEQRFEPGKIDRATLYAWLATCKKPPYIGFAINNCELDWNTPNCQTFVRWLEDLFEPDP